MAWTMGVHVGPAEDTISAPPPPKPKELPVNTITPPDHFQPIPEPVQTIIPPTPVNPVAAGMSLTVPGKSTADGMWLAVQSMVALKGRMEAETKAVQAAVAQIGGKVDTIAEMRKMLQDYADKLTI